ncbi:MULTISPECIES: hypothetical protein [Mesorhizobium]|uniref:hypothetical protein n=1 Tax=Mesorhizobium TaxID=68287 RepID=UPI001F33E951|nr:MULTISPECIES: hypothetical protein [Mesorhizobium]MCF6122487.1 hypothetical protein [Mesorhizobium ciceri]MCQ8815676.1 hypothetical protein [Mesorhizobium sp. SEMIA396]
MVAKADVRKFFKVYEKIYNDAIADTVDLNDVADMYSAGFVSVTPAAVMVGENGEQLKAIMTKGFGLSCPRQQEDDLQGGLCDTCRPGPLRG